MAKKVQVVDINQSAKVIVDLATSEGEELKKSIQKNPAAVELGRLGGKKGGPARAKKLTPKKRSSIAKKAAKTRWAKAKKKKTNKK